MNELFSLVFVAGDEWLMIVSMVEALLLPCVTGRVVR